MRKFEYKRIFDRIQPNPYLMNEIQLQRFAVKTHVEKCKLQNRLSKVTERLDYVLRTLEQHNIKFDKLLEMEIKTNE